VRVAVLLIAIAGALLVAGCGDSDDGSSDDWAANVCAEVDEWVDEVDATFESLAERGSQLDEDDVQTAADRVTEATDELEAGLDDLGPPETEESRQARQELESLGDALRGHVDEIEGALAGDREPLEAVAAVATAFAAAANDLQRSLDTLERLDPGGELAEDFRTADECVALRERFEDTGS
jgi:hypothetical protein